MTDLIPYGGWLVKGGGGGALVRRGPPRVKGAARPCGTGSAGRFPAGPCRSWAGETAGRAVPCPLIAPRRLGRDGSLPSGGYRSALDRLRDRRRGCPTGKAASFVGATRV